MKKIFLIFVAAVVLPSVAFAQAYGEKSRPDSVGAGEKWIKKQII